MARTCRACRHSYQEPDSGLVCGHPDAGPFGLLVRDDARPNLRHCYSHERFEQHPLRTPTGGFKPISLNIPRGAKAPFFPWVSPDLLRIVLEWDAAVAGLERDRQARRILEADLVCHLAIKAMRDNRRLGL